MPFASSTSTAARSTSPPSSVIDSCSMRSMRRWRDMVATRMYLTGGLGSRHRDEAFGDPFELPPDRAYAETCASIASVMLAWRLFLATGDPDYADVLERTAFNGVLPGVSSDGTRFFYVNALQRRTTRVAGDEGDGDSRAMVRVCLLPAERDALPELVAAVRGDARRGRRPDPPVRNRRGPEQRRRWDGSTRDRDRLPMGWPRPGDHPRSTGDTVDPVLAGARLESNGQRPDPAGETVPIAPGLRRVDDTRVWRSGDTVTLMLDMPVRMTSPDPRVDAARGCVALERGPLVYCVETADLPGGVTLEELELDPAAKRGPVDRPDLGREVVGLAASRRGEAAAPSRSGPSRIFGLGPSDGPGDACLDPALVVGHPR